MLEGSSSAELDKDVSACKFGEEPRLTKREILRYKTEICKLCEGWNESTRGVGSIKSCMKPLSRPGELPSCQGTSAVASSTDYRHLESALENSEQGFIRL